MGRLYIEEYDNSKKGSVAEQRLYIKGTASTSAAMNEQTVFVRLSSDEDCYFAVDSTATNNSRMLFAKTDLVIAIKPEQTISVISRAVQVGAQQSITAFNELSVAETTPIFQAGFPYNVNSGLFIESVTGSGAVTHTDAKAKIDTTAATSSTARLISRDRLKYNHGEGAVVRFAGFFTTGVAGSEQIMGIGTSNDGFFFGYNGATFGVLRRQNGSGTWVDQTDWSEDPCDGTASFPTLDFTKGNVFQIKFQWLGFGEISFYIENPDTGTLVRVHRIQYANTATTPSVFNPTFPFCADAANTTNNTSIAIYLTSVMLGVEGKNEDLGIIHAVSNGKAAVDTTLTNILTIRNKTSFASKTNQSVVKIALLDLAVDGTKPSDFQLILNTTLGGSPSYTDIDTDVSIIDYDTAGTTITGGRELFAPTLAKSDSRTIDLSPWRILLNPGDILTIAAQASVGTIDAEVSLTWVEIL